MPTKSTRRKNSVVVQFAVPRRGLPSAASLRRWALAVASSRVNLRVVGESEGRRMNAMFRKKDRATNVLTFDTGDVVLCHPVIAREAREQGKSLAAHYAHLVVHGILHLRGYRHEKKKQADRMEKEEIRRLARLGFQNPYELE